MGDSKPDFTTIKFSPDCEIGEISRVALASILRIHQIDPAVVSELAVAMQQEINAPDSYTHLTLPTIYSV